MLVYIKNSKSEKGKKNQLKEEGKWFKESDSSQMVFKDQSMCMVFQIIPKYSKIYSENIPKIECAPKVV